MTISVLVTVDLPMGRMALRSVLEAELESTSASEGEGGDRGLKKHIQFLIDPVIPGLNLAEFPGGKSNRKLNESTHRVKINVLAVDDKGKHVNLRMEKEVNGCILKDELEKILTDSVRSILRGKTRLGNCDQVNAVGEENSSDALTSREREVLRLVAQGKSNKEIGMKLNIAERTVRSHLENIMQKLEVKNRTEAAMAAGKLGWT